MAVSNVYRSSPVDLGAQLYVHRSLDKARKLYLRDNPKFGQDVFETLRQQIP